MLPTAIVAEIQNGDSMKEMMTECQFVLKGSGKSVGEKGDRRFFKHDDVTLGLKLSPDDDDLDHRTHMYSMWLPQPSQTSPGKLSRAGDLGVHQLVQT
jgi:hypothetical protein